ncbi:MAG: GFA family protein [Leptolyngbya sp. SIO1E4]|nr:GFA family protein [Leptolyngbya sp. SIO1E4]
MPFHETNCHCSVCHRTSGAPFVTWFSVPKSCFEFISGAPTKFRSTVKGPRTFCPHCGTSLTSELNDFPDEIDVTTCSLDNPELLPPKDHTRTSSKLPWVPLSNSLPAYQESRHDG